MRLHNCLLLCLLGVSTYFVGGTVGREAILNGQIANNHEFPYMVSIQIHGHGYVCSGGIIGDKFVLTAAHCVLNRERQFRSPHISIHAGTSNYLRTDPPAISVKVDEIFFPDEFEPLNKHTTNGDIAVLKVEPLESARHPVYLANLQLPRNDDTEDIAKIAGFGWRTRRLVGNRLVGDADGNLRHTNAQVLSKEACESIYPIGTIDADKSLCAGTRLRRLGLPVSACVGDAGGPLVHNGTVIGVLSRFARDCNELVKPAVYARVFFYKKMITNVMQHGHDPHMIRLRPFP